MNSTSRRQFLTLLGATGLSAAIPSPAFAALAPSQEPFTFLFLTDAHLQPELNGVIGTDMAFTLSNTTVPEPSGLMLDGSGLLVLAGFGRRLLAQKFSK